MPLYQRFIFQLIKNYLIGSFVAVAGVGSLFIFHTLILSQREIVYMFLILAISITVMIALEFMALNHHLKPIKDVLHLEHPSKQQLDHAFRHTQSFPTLAFKRTIGPHMLGLSIPAIVLAYFFIKFDLLNIPYVYILLAGIGAILIASFHGMIEFYLTSKSIMPVLEHIRSASMRLHDYDPTSQPTEILSIRKKFISASIFFSVFPLLLFSLASQVRLIQDSSVQWIEYWSWALLIIVISVLFSLVGSFLFFRDINTPIDQLIGSMKHIEKGTFTTSTNLYTDEFSSLVNGFNKMVESVQARERMNKQLIESFYSVLSTTLDARDPYTAGHSQRVSSYAVEIGKLAGLTDQVLVQLKNAALLHDIGKIGVPDSVLLKDGKLTDEEFERIKKHPRLGAKILEQVQPFDAMEPLLPGVHYHHERFDGKGYPAGLTGFDIPMFGRIIAVADAYDAMTSDRPYRKGMATDDAVSILKKGAGTQWDPEYIEYFTQYIGDSN